MDIKQTAQEIHNETINKGFVTRGEKRPVPELLMLTVSELGEALEANRKGRWADRKGFDVQTELGIEQKQAFTTSIKDTFEDEIADACIRLFQLSEEYGFDLEWHMRQKMNYNGTRPHKHGKNY